MHASGVEQGPIGGVRGKDNDIFKNNCQSFSTLIDGVDV